MNRVQQMFQMITDRISERVIPLGLKCKNVVIPTKSVTVALDGTKNVMHFEFDYVILTSEGCVRGRTFGQAAYGNPDTAHSIDNDDTLPKQAFLDQPQQASWPRL